MDPAPLPRIGPVEGVLEVVRRGKKTGTNKLGLLLVLLDVARERIEDNRPVSREELVDRTLHLHWQHGRPYGETELRQMQARKARMDGSVATDTTVMQQVHRLRRFLRDTGHGGVRDYSFPVVLHRVVDPGWETALGKARRAIAKDLWRNPVKRLQNLPGRSEPFLYTVVGNQMQFLPDVPRQLAKYSDVLKPLIQFEFAQLAARASEEHRKDRTFDLRRHLFHSERAMIPPGIREGLIGLQNNRCVYTGRPLSSDPELDHVIPWARTPLSHIENLVMTRRSVNREKSDSLLGPVLVNKWLDHVAREPRRIRQLADKHQWPTDFDHVRGVARTMYSALGPASAVWEGTNYGITFLGGRGRAKIIDSLNRSHPAAARSRFRDC